MYKIKKYRGLIVSVAAIIWGALGYQYFFYEARDGLRDNFHLTTISSKLYGADRDFIIRLPTGYQTSGIDYPLIVKLDGLGLLSLHDDILTQISRATDRSDAIIVAIPNASGKRLNELTPTGWTLRGYDNVIGEGDKFLEFITQEVIPDVRSKYRTGGTTHITGNSLGGLMVVYAIIQHPDIFDGGFAFSPSFWANDTGIVLLLKKSLDDGLWAGKMLFMALGDREPSTMQRPYAMVIEMLTTNAPDDFHGTWLVLNNGTHASTQTGALSLAYHSWATLKAK